MELHMKPRAAVASTDVILQQQILETAKCMVCESYPDLICAITQALLHEAVMTEDGHLYSADALRTWWQDKVIFTSPATGAVLARNHASPAFSVREHIVQLLSEVIKSGQAGALTGSKDSILMRKALNIKVTIAALSPAEMHDPSDVFVQNLMEMCEDVYLRDFAATCGALNVASACFIARQNCVTVGFLLRMLKFQAEHQEKLAFLVPVAVMGLSSLDVERQCHSFEVLSALVCDRNSIPAGLEEAFFHIFSPVITRNVVRAEVPAIVFRHAMLFLLHLLMGKQYSMAPIARKLEAVGVPAMILHVLQTMKDDIGAISIACWLVRVLAEIDDELKTTLAGAAGLHIEIENALSCSNCTYFALRALAEFSDERDRCLVVLDSISSTPQWLLNPRMNAMNAVQAMQEYPKPMHMNSLCLSILSDATDKTGEVLQLGVPSTGNVIAYILRNGVESVVDAIKFSCTQGSWATVQQGLSLLRNITYALNGNSKVRNHDDVMFISECITDALGAAAEGFKNEQRQCLRTLHAGLTVLRQYMDLMFDSDIQALQVRQNIIGLCRDSIADVQAATSQAPFLRVDFGRRGVWIANDTHQSMHNSAYDFICDAFSLIEFLCVNVDYSKIFLDDIAEHLVESLETFADNNLINFKIAEVLQTLICSSRFEPHSGTRAQSGKNLSYAKDVVYSKAYPVLLSLLERPLLDFKTVRLPVLTVLRDVAPSITLDEDHDDHVENWMEFLLQMIRDCLDTDTVDSALTVKVCVETIANLLIGETPGLFVEAPELPLKGWRAVIHKLSITPLMINVLRSFNEGGFSQASVLEQALRVIVLVSKADGCLSLKGRDLTTVAQTMNTVGSLQCTQRLKNWQGFEDRVCSDNAHCLEVACSLPFWMLKNVPDRELKAQAKILVDSQMVEALITVISRASLRARDPGNGDLYITQLGEETTVHVLRKLLPFMSGETVMRIADEFAAVILRNNKVLPSPPIDLSVSDDESKTYPKRSHASIVKSSGGGARGAAGGAAAKKKRN